MTISVTPRIWHVTVEIAHDHQRTFSFASDAEAAAFLADCQDRNLPTTITFATNSTAERATDWLDRQLNHGA